MNCIACFVYYHYCKNKLKNVLSLVRVLFFLFIIPFFFTAHASGLSSASASLSNPRLSFQGSVNANIAAGNIVIIIANSLNANNDTNHLFPNDPIIVGTNVGLKVNSVVDPTTFTINSALGTGVSTGDKVYVPEESSLVVSFKTGSDIPVGGSIMIKVPSSLGSFSPSQNDGLPDTAALANNGFDFNSLTAANVTCPAGFTAGTPAAGAAGVAHSFYCNWNGLVSSPGGSSYIVTIGDGTKGLVNPAPATGHVQGQADAYNILLSTQNGANGTGATVESVQTKVAPDEGVFVSATIDETLSFAVLGVSTANMSASCFGGGAVPAGNNVTSTATTVPFGSSILSNTFYNAAQLLTVFTNAPGGYSIKVEENDQMGKDGKVCPGASAGEAQECIKDTTCDGGACSEATSAEWATNTNNGLGYSLTNVGSSTDASFFYNESGRTFSAKHFADQEAPQTKRTIMSNASIVNGKSGCIIYRLSVSGTQPAGYYYNTVKYTASASF